jgi:hypothetical protein
MPGAVFSLAQNAPLKLRFAVNAITTKSTEKPLKDLQTRVFHASGKWVLQFKTSIMATPAYWHYLTEVEARNAERRLNPEAEY